MELELLLLLLDEELPTGLPGVELVAGYAEALELPELELIEGRIVGPIKEFQGILKAIRKSITKRQHKVRARSLSRLRA